MRAVAALVLSPLAVTETILASASTLKVTLGDKVVATPLTEVRAT